MLFAAVLRCRMLPSRMPRRTSAGSWMLFAAAPRCRMRPSPASQAPKAATRVNSKPFASVRNSKGAAHRQATSWRASHKPCPWRRARAACWEAPVLRRLGRARPRRARCASARSAGAAPSTASTTSESLRPPILNGRGRGRHDPSGCSATSLSPVVTSRPFQRPGLGRRCHSSSQARLAVAARQRWHPRCRGHQVRQSDA